MRQKHKTVISDNGVYYEVRLLIPRQLYLKLKFYERATGRKMEDIIMEVLTGCIDEARIS